MSNRNITHTHFNQNIDVKPINYCTDFKSIKILLSVYLVSKSHSTSIKQPHNVILTQENQH